MISEMPVSSLSNRPALRPEYGLFVAITLLLVSAAAVLLNVPGLQFAIGIPTYFVVPGLLILVALRVSSLDVAERIVLSVLLSVVFLIWVAVLTDVMFLLGGFSSATPLAPAPLSIAITATSGALCMWGYKRNPLGFSLSLPRFSIDLVGAILLVAGGVLPLLSTLGAIILDRTGDNYLLLVYLSLLLVYILAVIFLADKRPAIYPFAVMTVGISLVLMYCFRAGPILGQDIHIEYYYANLTTQKLRLDFAPGYLESVLGVTLLPTVIRSLFAIDTFGTLKYLFPLLFTLGPLALYNTFRTMVSARNAFIAAVFFTCQTKFFFVSDVRSPLTLTFGALSLMILFHNRLAAAPKRLLFLILFFTVIASNYTTSLLLELFLASAFVLPVAARWRDVSRAHVVTGGSVLLGAIGFFFWYGQVFYQPYEQLISVVYTTAQTLADIFIFENTRSDVVNFLVKGSPVLADKLGAISIYMSYFFILVGLVAAVSTVWRRAGRRLGFLVQPDFWHTPLSPEYLGWGLGAFAALSLWLAVPYASLRYDIGRFFATSLLVLALFFVAGGIAISRALRIPPHIPLLLALMPYVAFSSGLAYDLMGSPRYVFLESRGDNFDRVYVYQGELSAVDWLAQHKDSTGRVYADIAGTDERLAERIPFQLLARVLSPREEMSGYVYLRHFNLVSGKILSPIGTFDIEDIQQQLTTKNKIYANGYAEVYR